LSGVDRKQFPYPRSCCGRGRPAFSLKIGWRKIKALTSDVQDTLLSVGADATMGTQQVRALVKAAGKTTPGLRQLAESLAPRPARAPVLDTPAAETPKPVSGPEAASAPAPETSPSVKPKAA